MADRRGASYVCCRRALCALAAVVFVGGSSVADDRPTGIHTVRIDAVATDARGRAVSTLKPNDFELRQDGVVQTIETAQFRSADSPRLFAIFLDEYHLSPVSVTDELRAALRTFVDSSLGPHDLLVVMRPLDSLFAIKLTEERDAAYAAFDSFQGRRGDYEPRNAYERNFIAGTPARIDAARDQVALSAINALAVHLGSLGDARKTLLVVTERVGRSDRRRGMESLPTLDAIVRSANRSNVAIYPIDPREDAAPDEASQRLARDTDGSIISGDLASGLQRAALEGGSYYLLTYRASHPEDGGVHSVRVTTTRAGVRIHARSAYWAPSPEDALRAAVLERINHPVPPKPPEPMRHVSPLIQPWFGLSRGEAGRTRITLVWEPVARVPGDRTARSSPSRVVVKALAADDSVLFEGPLSPTGAGALEPEAGAPARAVFDAPPGAVRLRMSIEDAAAQPLDLDVRDISVPDFQKPVTIGTPAIVRARNQREFRLLSEGDPVPVAARTFRRTEHLLIRFPAYSADNTIPTVTAKLLSRGGQPIRDLRVVSPEAAGGQNQIDLSLASFAAGEYLIDLSAASRVGSAKERISFRITW